MISLGIDLGGTQIKYGLVEDGKILDCGICDTRLEEGYQAVVHRMADCAKSFLRGAEAEFVGIASPGLVDTYQGVVRYSNNFGWHNVPLAKDLSDCLELPARIANDAQCASTIRCRKRDSADGDAYDWNRRRRRICTRWTIGNRWLWFYGLYIWSLCYCA